MPGNFTRPPADATLVSAIERLPEDPHRGFSFYSADGEPKFYSFGSMRDEAFRRAAQLQAEGVTKGDRVALIVHEGEQFVHTFLGCVCAGGIPVPIYPQLRFRDLGSYRATIAYILQASRASLLVASRLVAEKAELATLTGAHRTVEAETLSLQSPPRYRPVEFRHEDLCFLQFTSGSTAQPKGVCVSHGNLAENARAFLGPGGLGRRDDDLGLSWLPLYHDMGLIGFVLGPLFYDIPVILMPPESFARAPRRWLELLSAHRATITYAPNFAYQLVSRRVKDRDLERLDLSRLRVAGCGAEPIHAQTLRAFAERLAPVGFKASCFVPSYGMAESTLAITMTKPGSGFRIDAVDADALAQGVAKPPQPGKDASSDAAVSELVGCGQALPGFEIRICDPHSGESCGQRQVGEVVVRGPSVTRGYFHEPASSASAFRDGWLWTGDLGYFVDDELFICGRSKDLIIVNGANYFPQDIEWTVSEVAGVRQGGVVAFGMATSQGNEELIVAAECTSADAAACRQEIAARCLAKHSLAPQSIVLLPPHTLPKTSSGKPQRRKTKALFVNGQLDAAQGQDLDTSVNTSSKPTATKDT